MQPLTANPERAWTCLACGAAEPGALPPAICVCGAEQTFVPAAARQKTRPVLVDRLTHRTRFLPTGEEVDRLLGGGLPRGHVVLVAGAPGSGKTRLCLRWASLAGEALACSLEMGLGPAADCARSAGAAPRRLWLTDDLAELYRGADSHAVLVLDSLGYSRRPGEVLSRLVELAKRSDCAVLAICHVNARNKVSGPTALQHAGDATLWVSPGSSGSAFVKVAKSRFSISGASASFELAPGSTGTRSKTIAS